MRFLCLFLIIQSFSAFASDDSFLDYRVLIKAGSFSVDDPDGDSPKETAVIPGLAVSFDLSGRGQQLVAGFEFLSIEFEGDAGEVNQEVDGYTLSLAYEKQLVMSRHFKPWVGFGALINSHTFENRFSTDADGFLDQLYVNREETYFGFSLYADNYFQLSDSLFLGLGPYVDFSVSDGLSSVGVRTSLLLK